LFWGLTCDFAEVYEEKKAKAIFFGRFGCACTQAFGRAVVPSARLFTARVNARALPTLNTLPTLNRRWMV
jgi:hypothetical protein